MALDYLDLLDNKSVAKRAKSNFRRAREKWTEKSGGVLGPRLPAR